MKHVNLRLPDDLHALLVAAAKDDTRSLNSEIIHLLRRALERRST
jgi:predicted HicB family RNase H-like nuclease